MIDYMKGGNYNLAAFQQMLLERVSTSTALIYVSVVRSALRDMHDTSPTNLAEQLLANRSRSFPAAWRLFVEFARARGRTVADIETAANTSIDVNVIHTREHFIRPALVEMMRVAVSCYWDFNTTIPLSAILADAMQRFGRSTWRTLTGVEQESEFVTSREDYGSPHLFSGERGALQRLLFWGWGVRHINRDVTPAMEGLTLFPRTPKQNEQMGIEILAGLALGAGDRKLAGKLIKGHPFHLPVIGSETPAYVDEHAAV